MKNGAELIVMRVQVLVAEEGRDARVCEGARRVDVAYVCVRTRAQHQTQVQLTIKPRHIVAIYRLPYKDRYFFKLTQAVATQCVTAYLENHEKLI